jgi:hypothetical protein
MIVTKIRFLVMGIPVSVFQIEPESVVTTSHIFVSAYHMREELKTLPFLFA